MQREIVLDTETTGIDFRAGHRVIEIGCVELIDGRRTGETYHQYINPQRDIDAKAESIHGLSADFLKDKPIFKDVAEAFSKFIGDSKIIAHNAKFDVGFLNHHLEEEGLSLIKQENVIDTLPMARRKHPGQKNSLDALCSRYNVDNSNRDFHGALLDSELLADVYAELIGIGSNQQNIQFEDEKSAASSDDDLINKPAFITKNGAKYSARNYSNSPEELEAHAKMLKKIKNPAWDKIN